MTAIARCPKPMALGVAGFQVRGGGGGFTRAPKSGWGGLGWEKGSIDRHPQSVIMISGTKGGEKIF